MKHLSLAFVLLAACVTEPAEPSGAAPGGGKTDDPTECSPALAAVLPASDLTQIERVDRGALLFQSGRGLERLAADGERELLFAHAGATPVYDVQAWDDALFFLEVSGQGVGTRVIHERRLDTGAARHALDLGVSVQRFAVDDEYFYLTSVQGDLYRRAREGGAPSLLRAGVQVSSRLLSDATHVYYLDEVTDALWRIDRESGETAQVAALELRDPASASSLHGLAVTADYVYWSEAHDEAGFDAPVGFIGRYTKATGAVEQWATEVDGVSYLDADEVGVYWVAPDTADRAAAVRARRHDGSESAEVIPASADVLGLARVGGSLYVMPSTERATDKRIERIATCGLLAR